MSMQDFVFGAGLGCVLLACSGCGSSSGNATVPSGTPTAATAQDPRATLAAGPVASVTIVVRPINAGEREPSQDAQGRWLVAPGERVDFDATQTNAGGAVRRWNSDPIWYVDGGTMPLESGNGMLFRRGSTQPFLLKLTVQNPGSFSVQAEIDGVRSNVLLMQVAP